MDGWTKWINTYIYNLELAWLYIKYRFSWTVGRSIIRLSQSNCTSVHELITTIINYPRLYTFYNILQKKKCSIWIDRLIHHEDNSCIWILWWFRQRRQVEGIVSKCLSSQPDQGHTTNSQFSVLFVQKEKSSPVQFADHFWITCGLYIVGK